jgi:hypothetical protein
MTVETLNALDDAYVKVKEYFSPRAGEVLRAFVVAQIKAMMEDREEKKHEAAKSSRDFAQNCPGCQAIAFHGTMQHGNACPFMKLRHSTPGGISTAEITRDATLLEPEVKNGHIINGEFQSDKYPTCPRGKFPISIRDKMGQDLLWEYARRHEPKDLALSQDLRSALLIAGFSPVSSITVKLDALRHDRKVLADLVESRLKGTTMSERVEQALHHAKLDPGTVE